jgi:hypothetical protein
MFHDKTIGFRFFPTFFHPYYTALVWDILYWNCIQNDEKNVLHGITLFDIWKQAYFQKRIFFRKCAYLFFQLCFDRELSFEQITKMWKRHCLVMVFLFRSVWLMFFLLSILGLCKALYKQIVSKIVLK